MVEFSIEKTIPKIYEKFSDKGHDVVNKNATENKKAWLQKADDAKQESNYELELYCLNQALHIDVQDIDIYERILCILLDKSKNIEFEWTYKNEAKKFYNNVYTTLLAESNPCYALILQSKVNVALNRKSTNSDTDLINNAKKNTSFRKDYNYKLGLVYLFADNDKCAAYMSEVTEGLYYADAKYFLVVLNMLNKNYNEALDKCLPLIEGKKEALASFGVAIIRFMQFVENKNGDESLLMEILEKCEACERLVKNKKARIVTSSIFRLKINSSLYYTFSILKCSLDPGVKLKLIYFDPGL